MFDTLINPSDTNVISLGNTKNVAAAQPETDIYFPVQEYPLADLTGQPDRGYKAVVRTDTNEIIAVNGSKYKLMPNKDVFNVVDQAIKKASGLKTDGMYIKDSTAHMGATTVRNYVFPEHSVTVNKGDVTEMRITVVNSYDGASQFKMLVGGFRLICLNGMVAGKVINKYSGRHTSGLNIGDMGIRLSNGIHGFSELSETWKQYADTKCTDGQAAKIIGKMTASENVRNSLMIYWLTEKATLGANMWALFNAMTYYSTHHKISRGKGNEAMTIVAREAEVAKALPLLLAA